MIEDVPDKEPGREVTDLEGEGEAAVFTVLVVDSNQHHQQN